MEKVRFNMVIDKKIRDFVKDKAWENRMSATAYLVELVKKEMEKEKDGHRS